MKIYVFVLCTLFLSLKVVSQEKKAAFRDGEWLRYKMSYSGFLRA
jgi:hypothetical protein